MYLSSSGETTMIEDMYICCLWSSGTAEEARRLSIIKKSPEKKKGKKQHQSVPCISELITNFTSTVKRLPLNFSDRSTASLSALCAGKLRWLVQRTRFLFYIDTPWSSSITLRIDWTLLSTPLNKICVLYNILPQCRFRRHRRQGEHVLWFPRTGHF